jgi:hypothetical protein
MTALLTVTGKRREEMNKRKKEKQEFYEGFPLKIDFLRLKKRQKQ